MNTEERIIKVFKEMAYHQGFNAIKMEDLASGSGITKKTIYSYFTCKQDLVEKVVNAFLDDVPYRIESVMSKSDLIENVADTVKSLIKDGAFLFNVRSLKDLQVYYPETWQRVQELRVNMVSSVVDIIYKRTKKKWVLEMDPNILKEAFLAINARFSTPEFAVEMGMPIEKLTFELAKILIYPYL